MKNFLFLIVNILISSATFAQVTPEAFLSMLPAIPDNVCSDEINARNNFIAKLDSISELIENETSRRKENIDANSEDYEKQVMNKFAKQYGLSQEDMKKLQNDDEMTDAEKDALINKALQNSANISLDEVKNLKKMSKEGKEAWAEAYSTEKMAEIQADPQKNQDEQLKNKSLFELTAMQKHIIDSIKAVESKFAKQFEDIDKDKDAKTMLDNISKLEREIGQMMGELSESEQVKFDALVQKLKSEKDKYCSKYTPQYIAILQRYESYTKSCLPVCYRLEKISAQLSKLQTGVDMKQEPGSLAIGKVAGYLGKLRGVYKYNLYKY